MKFMRNFIILLIATLLHANVFAVSKQGFVNIQPNLIEGKDYEGKRWAYEFKVQSGVGFSNKPSLQDNNFGQLIYEDTEYIVLGENKMATSMGRKTELSFYNAKTLEYINSLSVPNIVIEMGRIGGNKQFYIITRTANRYRYDDGALVLVLADISRLEIQRFILSEDNKLSDGSIVEDAFQSGSSDMNTVNITLKGNRDLYTYPLKGDGPFKNVLINIIQADNENHNKLDLGKNMHAGAVDFINSPFMLYELGLNKNREGYIADLDAACINEIFSLNKSCHVITKQSRSGGFLSLDLTHLKSRFISDSQARIFELGVLNNGLIAYIGLDQNEDIHYFNVDKKYNYGFQKGDINLLLDNKKTVIPLPRGCLSSGIKNDKFYICDYKNLILSQISHGSTSFQLENITSQFPYLDKFFKEGINSYQEVFVDPKSQTVNYLCSSNEFKWKFIRAKWSNGDIIQDYCFDDGGKTPNFFLGESPSDWTLISWWSGYTGGGVYTASLQNLKTNVSYKLITYPTESTILFSKYLSHNKMLVVTGCRNNLDLFVFDPDNGNLKNIGSWKIEGTSLPPLFEASEDILFVPKLAGYELLKVCSIERSQKIADLYFSGKQGYAFFLPNGFYAGSPGCEKLIKIPSNGSLVDATSLAPWKNRPAEVIKALGGDPKTADLLGKVTDRWLKRIGFDPSTPEPNASEIAKVSVPQMPPLWATSSSVSFPIEATAGGEPLKEVAVRVNGVLQKSFSGSELNIPKGGHATLNASVTLAEGQNWIEVTATDAKGRPGNLQHFRTILQKASETPKRYIVAMGCSEYDRPELNLQFAAKDAGDVIKTFSEAGGRECKTLLLTNKDVGPEALEKIKAFVGESKESDEVILFCAGHGMLDEHYDYVYAGHQIDPEHAGQTGVKLDALLEAIGSGKSLKRLVLMDTCQSGAVGEKEEMKLAQASTELPHGVRAIKSRALKVVGTTSLAGDDQQRFIEEMFLLPGQHQGINIIGASGGAEYAMESDKWNNGVFTSALIEAMRDQKADMDHRGRISVSDLKTYLAQRVPELTGGAQKPSVVAFEQDQDFDLVGNMPPVPESVKNNPGTTVSEVPTPAASGATVSESSSVAQPNLGSQFVNSLGQKFVPIPGTPAYFCIWDTRVSDYGRFVQETGRAWKPAGFPQKPDHPAVRINYNDATAFCEWLTQKEHASGKLPQDCEYRLPKDLEWSAAAGIGPEAPGLPRDRDGAIPNCYAWGTNWPPPPGAGNFDPKLKTDKFPYTSPVGSFAPNKYVLYDISGNVFQWIKEDFDETGLGFLRGGSWPDEAEENLNLSGRCKESKENGYKCYGFRCVIAPIAQK
jgi:hypothetical protein